MAIIGAGGFVFPLRLVGDVFFAELQDAELALTDTDPQTLARTAGAARDLVSYHSLKTRIPETTDRREALAGADLRHRDVPGRGLEAYRRDVCSLVGLERSPNSPPNPT